MSADDAFSRAANDGNGQTAAEKAQRSIDRCDEFNGDLLRVLADLVADAPTPRVRELAADAIALSRRIDRELLEAFEVLDAGPPAELAEH